MASLPTIKEKKGNPKLKRRATRRNTKKDTQEVDKEMKEVERSRRYDQVNDKKGKKKKKKKRHRISKRDGTASCAGSTPYVTSVPLQGKCPMPPNNTG